MSTNDAMLAAYTPELQEIIAELQGILARSADAAVADKELPR
jgi:hypothetical protein